MKPNTKTVQMIIPTTAITAASTNTGYVDTKGYNYLTIDVVEMSASAATQVTALGLAEGDTVPTSYTSETKIAAFTGAAATSTSAGFVLPTPSSTVENLYRFNVDLRGRKRYITLLFQPAVSTRAAAIATLSMPQEGPAMVTASATSVVGARVIATG